MGKMTKKSGLKVALQLPTISLSHKAKIAEKKEL